MAVMQSSKNPETDVEHEYDELITDIKAHLDNAQIPDEFKKRSVEEWEDDPSFNDYVVRKMYSMLARNYMVNLVLAGRLEKETYLQMLSLGESQEGCRTIAINFMLQSLEVPHNFKVPEELEGQLYHKFDPEMETVVKKKRH
jgi:hypothetical protein